MPTAGAIIRDLRQQRGLTQEALASAAGVKFSFLRSVECGRNALRAYDKRAALAKGLGLQLVDLARLLDGPSPPVDVTST